MKKVLEQLQSVDDFINLIETIIIVLDEKGKVAKINKKGAEVLGYPKKDIIGKDWFKNFLLEDNIPEIKAVYNKLMEGDLKNIEYYENSIKTSSGKEKIISWHNAIITDKDGNNVGILSSGTDISLRVKEKELLKKKNIQLEKINDLTTDRELKMIEMKNKMRDLERRLKKNKK